MCVWKLLYNIMDRIFFGGNFFFIRSIRIRKKLLHSLSKSLTLFGKGFPVKGILNHPYRYISHTVCIC